MTWWLWLIVALGIASYAPIGAVVSRCAGDFFQWKEPPQRDFYGLTMTFWPVFVVAVLPFQFVRACWNWVVG